MLSPAIYVVGTMTKFDGKNLYTVSYMFVIKFF